MDKLTFKSSLALEEIEADFKFTDLFSGIIEYLEEARKSITHSLRYPLPNTVKDS